MYSVLFLISHPMAAKKGLYSGASESGGKKTKVDGKKKTRNATKSLETLQKIKKSSRAEHGRPKRTRDNYAGYVERGKAFLEDLVAERRENVDRIGDRLDSQDDDIDIDLMEKAFDNPPNKYSVMVLELFLVQKCLTEKKGKSTATGIHGAFTDYWDNMWVDPFKLYGLQLINLSSSFSVGMVIPILARIALTRKQKLSRDVQHVRPPSSHTSKWLGPNQELKERRKQFDTTQRQWVSKNSRRLLNGRKWCIHQRSQQNHQRIWTNWCSLLNTRWWELSRHRDSPCGQGNVNLLCAATSALIYRYIGILNLLVYKRAT